MIAPEHLELMVNEPMNYLSQIKNAGSIFLGYYTCESIGDYFGGTNHVLPTNGTARFSSALGVDSFIKNQAFYIIQNRQCKPMDIKLRPWLYRKAYRHMPMRSK